VVWGDICRFYGWRNLLRLAAGLIVGGLLANLPLDQEFRDWYCQKMHVASLDRFHVVTKQFGEEHIIAACSVGVALVGCVAASSPAGAAVGAWGTLMVRALVVSTPPQVVGQRLLGAGRPSDHLDHGSRWRFCRSDKGISGHAMIGSLPFLVAAGMTANPVAQVALYVCSGLTAVSRVNSDSHYLSQVLLGWWVAFLAVRAVHGRLSAATRKD